MNCTFPPTLMVAFAGVRLTVCTVVTFRVVDPALGGVGKAAWIVVIPLLLLVAVEPVMVATAGTDEVHVATFDMS